MIIRNILICAGIALTSAPALAINVKATWTPPTARTDGTPLAASDLKGYEIEWVNLATMYRKTRAIGPTYRAYTLTGLAESRYGFRIRATDTGGLSSAWSPQLVVDVKPTTGTTPLPTPLPVPLPCDCTCPNVAAK